MKIKNQTVSIPLISNQHLNIHLYTLLNKVCNTDNEMAGKRKSRAVTVQPSPALLQPWSREGDNLGTPVSWVLLGLFETFTSQIDLVYAL